MRRHRPRWSLLGLGAIVVVSLFTYPVWRRFIPGRSSTRAFALASDAQAQVLSKIKDRDAASTAYVAMLTQIPIPTLTATLILGTATRSGKFVALDAVHMAEGSVKIYRLPDESLLISLESDFKVTNAPDLTVYLSGNDQPKTPDDMRFSGNISGHKLGALGGTVGTQHFRRAKDFVIDKYKSVVIYSESLQTVYSYATLR